MSNESSTYFVIRVEQGKPEIISSHESWSEAIGTWQIRDDNGATRVVEV